LSTWHDEMPEEPAPMTQTSIATEMFPVS